MESPPNMDPEVWRQLDALLSEALTLSEPERERWLSELPEKDRPLASSLREMLSRSPSTGFLRDPVSAEVLAAAGEQALEQPGARVGPYRLLRGLGVGGMGQVWLAERVDGTPRRQVALKLPRTSWAPGMAERLKQERDALAALEHPSIARLYDAGTTEEGRPYIAMEYVDGVPIDAYARAHGLSLRQRLALFLQVAGAVSHAHAHLVVHRDLKPSNILVSETQGVRLLDFGAAKLLREEGPGADSELTQEMGPALSPDYASPEQIRGERVSVATDVYSLGVVLYELVTGQRPYRLSRESWAALVESVGRLEVPVASSRVRDDARLTRALRGDLDAVLAKALRRAATERYGSVQAFADDVSRFLSGEPVRAKQQSVGERVWKFARRHSLAVGTAVGVTLLVGGAAGVALWQAKVARAEARRAERVRQFIASILTSATPRTGAGGVVTASDLLTAAAGRIESELGAEPGVAAELGDLVAQSFDSLGELPRAEPVLRATVARAEAVFGRSHPLTLRTKTRLANAVVLHDVPGAMAIIDQVVPEALRGLPGTAEQAVEALQEKSYILAKLNRAEDSYGAVKESIRLAEQYLGPQDERTIDAIGLLANTYGRFGNRPAEERAAADAVERARRAFGNQRPHTTLSTMERFYADAIRERRTADAVALFRQVLADQQKLDAVETTRTRDLKFQLGNALLLNGRLEEAFPLVREAVLLERQQNPADSDDRRAFAMGMLLALVSAQRTEEGLAQQEYLAALVARLGTEPHRSAELRSLRLVRLFSLAGQSDRARALVTKVEGMATPADEAIRLTAKLARAIDLRLQLRLPEAREQLEELSHGPGLDTLVPKNLSEVAAELGTVRLELGDVAGAQEQLRRCHELLVGAQIEPSIPVTTCLVGSARVQLKAGHLAEAEELLVPLAASWEHVNPDGPGRGEVLYWLARTEHGLGKEAAARRDAQLARSLLRRSNLPFLRRLLSQ